MTDDTLTAAVALLRDRWEFAAGCECSLCRDIHTVLAALEAAQPAEPTIAPHVDDLCVDRFAAAMKAKLAKKRAEGYGGWNDADECPPGRLASLLHSHLAKGDPLDIGNFAMMLWNRGESCARPAEPPATDGPAAERAEAERDTLRECVKAADGQLSRILHELAGSASRCWEPTPTGVFHSTQACEFVAAAIDELRAILRGDAAERAEAIASELREIGEALQDPRENLTHTTAQCVALLRAERDALRECVRAADAMRTHVRPCRCETCARPECDDPRAYDRARAKVPK